MSAKPSLRDRLEALARLQAKSGAFSSLASISTSFVDAVPTASVFATSLALFSMAEAEASAPSNKARESMRRAVAYLESQRSPSGTWNYLERGAKALSGATLPDDLDDASCALLAIAKASGKEPDGASLASFVRQLIACEEKAGGPYHTWVVRPEDRPRWRDLDVAVNANVGSALALGGAKLPALDAFIDAAVERKRLESLYYKSPLAIAYFIARYYESRGKGGERLAALVMERRLRDGSWGTSLETALAMCALLRLGMPAKPLEKAARSLAKRADARGLWKAEPLFIEEIRSKRAYYAGSDALTSAIAIEALALFERGGSRSTDSLSLSQESAADRVCAAAISKTRDHLSSLGEPTLSQCEAALQKIERGGMRKVIASLPERFSAAMASSKATDDLLAALGAANLAGWMGYTMQDDIVDGDADGRLLPASNVLVRLALSLLKRAAQTDEGKAYIKTRFDLMDQANAWEASSAALPRAGDGFGLPVSAPDYGDLSALADKSFGHALGPLVVLLRSGIAIGSEEFRLVESFFRHYLIARQLNDDAHDWADDFKKGRVNAASAPLVARYLKSAGGEGKRRASAKAALPDLQRLFWQEDVERVSQLVLSHCGKARRSLAASKLMRDASFADALLAPLEGAAKKASSERAKALEFIQAYS